MFHEIHLKIMNMPDFAMVESLFRRLLGALSNVFTEFEIAEVSEFVDVGEYGIALDTAVDIFAEERKVAPDDVIALIEELAVAMDLSPREYADRLQAGGRS